MRKWRVISTVLLTGVALSAVAAPWLAPHDPAAQLDLIALKNAPPSFSFPLGTDAFSRDLLSRAMYGARTSLGIGALGALISTTIAAVWGLSAGWLREGFGDAMMGFVDTFRAIPRKVMLLATLLFFPQPTTVTLALLLGVTSWTATSRVVFVQMRLLKSREFISAARALGVSPWRVLCLHVAPHVMPSLCSASALLLSDILAAEAGLSFIGLGVRPPQASWGSILQDGLPYLSSAWWVAATPCVLLVATVLSVARLADTPRSVTLSEQ